LLAAVSLTLMPSWRTSVVVSTCSVIGDAPNVWTGGFVTVS
jgi:hypothetical protein